MPSGVDVGLDHDTGNAPVTSNQLLANRVDNFGLIVVVLERISVWNEVVNKKREREPESDIREQSIITLGLY